MVFSSVEFIFVFMPLLLVVAFLTRHARYAFLFALFLGSFVFYGYWNIYNTVFLVSSIVINYVAAQLICALADRKRIAFAILVTAVSFDLGSIFFFKYFYFFSVEAEEAFGLGGLSFGQIILPLGISFFTFQQIAYVVDVYRGEQNEPNLMKYGLFVAFFPQLIAGPIMYHRDIIPQLERLHERGFTLANFQIGLAIFAVGLLKKTLIADNLANFFVDPVFAHAVAGKSISFADGWSACFAYSFQIYFDFSGYSDMAIGLGRIFGVRVPANFNSPYKARGIVDFWRRWHITLSQWLRTYLYFPLGGGRRGTVRQYVNIMVVMILGGLWHGAGWNFLIWGGSHGVFLAAEHWGRKRSGAFSRVFDGPFGILLTFLIVSVLWVPFRSTNIEGVGSMLSGMFLLDGSFLPDASLAGLADGWQGQEWRFAAKLLILAMIYVLVIATPNSLEIFDYTPPNLVREPGYALANVSFGVTSRLRYHETAAWSVITGFLFALGVLAIQKDSVFIYFQF